MMTGSAPKSPPQSRLAAWMLLLMACLLFGGLIVALTLGLFGAKGLIEPYLLPADAGSTTGILTPGAI